MTPPLRFVPLFMARPWGGRRLAQEYRKDLPADVPIGESWEIVDREEAQSVVEGGPWSGSDLNELWLNEREAIFGKRALAFGDRFPILVKLLDAADTLSVQVHPPVDKAQALGGEPKNELWYLAGATEDAHLYVGLNDGVTREAFAAALKAGEDVSTMLQRVDVGEGDAIFIPSGRVHAIGGGCLIVEIQQNSDTTYRVFDFNRPGLDGSMRELHIPQSMESIDWDDVEPDLDGVSEDGLIAETPYFSVSRDRVDGTTRVADEGECAIVCVLEGDANGAGPGEFLIVCADSDGTLDGHAEVLVATLPG